MKKPINILSIDFDYFQIVDADTLQTCYPDGKDLSTELSEVVWASHYTDGAYTKKIMSVKINEGKIKEMKSIMAKCPSNIPVLATNSHVGIYDFITNLAKSANTPRVNLVNVDMHHDMFNDNYELDCGNWIKFISEDFDTNVTWIANPVSKECYGLTHNAFNSIESDFGAIKPSEINAIFLCRSDTWTPPHLDKYFDDLLKYMQSHFHKMKMTTDIMKPREVKNLTDCIKTFKKT